MHAIEHDFPIESLSRLAKLESWRKEVNRPIYYTHKWWARRLGSVFRGILLGTLVEESEEIWRHFYQPHDFSDRIILDPFMGGGTTLGEAVKLGCRVIGCDINPVAWYLVRSALQRIDVTALSHAFRGLEEDVAPRIRRYYQSTWSGEQADVLYAFWVKTIRCPDCSTVTRLFPNWIFAKHAYPRRKPEAQALCPACGQIHVIHYQATTTTCPACGYAYNPQVGPARRTTFVCEGCGREHRIAESYRLIGSPPDHQLYALMLLLRDDRKVYKKPDEADFALYASAVAEWEKAQLRGVQYPQQEIPPGINTDQARSYNYRYWHEMFNARQLLSLTMLLQAILRQPDQAIRNQLLVLFSGTLEFNNMFCSFKGEGTGAVRPLFSHHILKPERTPLENNPWGTPKSSGSFSTLFERRLLSAQEYICEPFELRAVQHNGRIKGEKIYDVNSPIDLRLASTFDDIVADRANALILSGDAALLPLPDRCVDAVVTDPPYFDNVHYSELADFFYVWLKLALDQHVAAFASDSSRRTSEVQGTDARSFEDGLGAVFAECHRVLKPDGLVVFTFQHSRKEAWVALAGALERAQLRVVAAYPIKAEMAVATPKSQAKEPINLDIIFVCRSGAAQVPLSGLPSIDDVLERVNEQVLRLVAGGLKLSRGDLFVIAMSQFIVQCQRHNVDLSNHGTTDQGIALLNELQVALMSLSIDDLVTQSSVRQLRLLDEKTPYKIS